MAVILDTTKESLEKRSKAEPCVDFINVSVIELLTK